MMRSSDTNQSAYEPPRDCRRCERLALFRDANAVAEPTWFNGPVPCFGSESAQLVIVGLAPGLKGANRTGRPFTGDYAGDLLYATLLKYGFASGRYDARPDDGLELNGCMIANAVRCVPPQNKPEPSEIANCRPFLTARLEHVPNLAAIIALGRIAHDQVLAARGIKKSLHPFSHGARHAISPSVALFDSYHCSRYNTNTRRLTPEMFETVFAAIRSELDGITP
jgi:uracil-DNA glycosylase